MALPTTGPLSLLNIRTEFGGTGAIAISAYYRGGAFVPSSVANIEPTSADTTNIVTESGSRFFYNRGAPNYFIEVIFYTDFGDADFALYWDGSLIEAGSLGAITSVNQIPTSDVFGSSTYFRTAASQQDEQDPEFNTETFYYAVRRQTGTVSVNTSVPTGGTIKISDFYGAKSSL